MSGPPSDPKAAPAPPKELTGKIGPKYEIKKLLGKGAMGQVYLADDTVLEREVALKVMVSNIADDPELKMRFEREAKAVAKMTHPNVVTVFDLGYHTDGSPYIAMELLKGQDLQKAVRQVPAMTVERKVAIIVQVLAGLAHAHQAGIVHRDIKPANIFINTDGSVKIMDFGVARLTTASMTGTGNIVGTADYMSPEQVKGSKVDGRSDLFSVGCMLYELVAGKRPFHSDNLMAIFYKITHEEANFDLIPAGDEYDALLPILRRALSKNLEDRYQTAYEFAMELRTWLQVHASSATAQHALEALVDLEAPTSPPLPLTDSAGPVFLPVDAGEMGGTVDLGTGRRTRSGSLSGRPITSTGRSLSGTKGGPTLVDPGTGFSGTQRPGTTRLGGPIAPSVRPGRPAPAPSGHPVLYVVLGAMGVTLVGLGGYVYWQKQQPPPVTPITVALATPSAPPPSEATPPPTPAPAPTFAEATGKAAASMKAAQSAFKGGSYEKALAAAQQALREDPGNADAQRLVDNALNGQKAQGRLRAAEGALRQNDYATAETEANAARSLAPWDAQATSMLSRIRDAQTQAQREAQQKEASQAAAATQQRTAQIATLLNQADGALGNRQYDVAIKLYDDALKLDPSNARAGQGRTGAITARTVAEAAASGGGGSRGGGKSFVPGKTQAASAETKAGNVPEGFEDSAGVAVKKGTQAADLPGKINFDFTPDAVKAGEKFTANVSILNEGAAPIQIQSMIVTTIVNGRRAQSPVPPMVKDVAPRSKAVLLSVSDIWHEDTTSWSMEITVRTLRGETYKNSVKWQ